MPVQLILIVEDQLSEAVAKKLLQSTGRDHEVVNTLRWNKDTIRKRIQGINRSAAGFRYFVLTDQDVRGRCPPAAIYELREPLHPNLLYRFAVLEIESWVLAHRQAVANFLSVPVRNIPPDTETINQPKEFLIQLARRSPSRRVKRDIVPRPGSTSKVGPDYNGQLSEFIREHWDVNVAAQASASLARAFQRIKAFC